MLTPAFVSGGRIYGDFIDPRGPVAGGEPSEPLLHLRAGHHGYYFPAHQYPPHESHIIPTEEVPARIPEPNMPFHLFVEHGEDRVEYLGRYQRMASARLWTWYRMTPGEWRSILSHPVSPYQPYIIDSFI